MVSAAGPSSSPAFDDGANRTVCDSFDLDDLRSRVFAGENSNGSSRDCEGVREQFYQFFVRRAVNRRRVEPDFQSLAVNADDLALRRAGLDAN
jgi:hypothetical protein